MIKKGITRKLSEQDSQDKKKEDNTMDILVKTVRVRKAVKRGR